MDRKFYSFNNEEKKKKNPFLEEEYMYEAVNRSQNQARRWRDVDENLSEEETKLIDRVLVLREKLTEIGIDYKFISRKLPTVSRNEAKDEEYFEDPFAIELPYYEATNAERWNNIKENASEEVVACIEELFDVLDELEKAGIKYKVVAGNRETLALPILKKGKEDPSPIQLL